MKKKIKFKGRRYAYGGPTDDGDGAMMTPTYDSPSEDSTSATTATPATPAAEQSFGQAFKAARKTMLAGGDETFMYKGKSYNTNLASDKKPVDKPVAPDATAPDAAARGRNAFKNLIDKRVAEDLKLRPNLTVATPRLNLNKGGSVKSSASKRADGIAQRGKTRGRNY